MTKCFAERSLQPRSWLGRSRYDCPLILRDYGSNPDRSGRAGPRQPRDNEHWNQDASQDDDNASKQNVERVPLVPRFRRLSALIVLGRRGEENWVLVLLRLFPFQLRHVVLIITHVAPSLAQLGSAVPRCRARSRPHHLPDRMKVYAPEPTGRFGTSPPAYHHRQRLAAPDRLSTRPSRSRRLAAPRAVLQEGRRTKPLADGRRRL